MSRSGKWSFAKTSWVTFFCGLGHVLSSVVLGLLGIGFGIAVAQIEIFESFRGNLAAWALIAFGLLYFVWGVRRAIRNKPHEHIHIHGEANVHSHEHVHNHEHLHMHTNKEGKKITPWILFTIFLLGPCEPLIPILMYPAAQQNLFGLVLVTVIFGLVTILTMLTIVWISFYGLSVSSTAKIERYVHAVAGATIFLCGASIQFLGL
jgi:sulfite exporter TauE/SafE